MSEPKAVRVIDLIREIEAAIGRMSNTNPHKIVMLQARACIIELAQRAVAVETPEAA